MLFPKPDEFNGKMIEYYNKIDPGLPPQAYFFYNFGNYFSWYAFTIKYAKENSSSFIRNNSLLLDS